jgi:hypothetical protein
MSAVANSNVLVQLESLQTGNPVSESALVAMAGGINYGITNSGKVGDVVSSDLDEATFQSLRDTTWVLSDGRSCVGTTYQTLTGLTNVPDRRGTVMRMKDNTRGLDPHGELAIGAYEADGVGTHQHDSDGIGRNGATPPYGSPGASYDAMDVNGESFISPNAYTGGPTGSPGETCVKAVVVNFFVKVNT